MKRPFAAIQPELQRDGALRDFYIEGTTHADWNKLMEWARPNLERDCFRVDGEVCDLPASFEEIEKIRDSASPLLSIPVGPSYLNCHFFHHSEIELDFWPYEYQSEENWEQLRRFFQNLTDLIGKRSIATHENHKDETIEEFHPKTNVEQGGGINSVRSRSLHDTP